MSSSTSSSDLCAGAGWAVWLGAFLGALGVGTALVFAFVIAVDPYDNGQFGFLGIEGVSDIVQSTANASRARDPQFDSAIIGDSTGQPIKPAELSRLTGHRFVQLTVQGAGPREHLAILEFFVRRHTHVGALVIAADNIWCSRDVKLPPPHPFPFWLYGESKLDYAMRLFSARSLGRAWRRVLIGLGRRARSGPDGYLGDYVLPGDPEFRPAVVPPVEPAPASADAASPDDGVFPAVVRLSVALSKIPADTPVVLFAPPFFVTAIARAGTAAAAEDEACKKALRDVVTKRTNGAFIDYRIDSAVTRDPVNFTDYFHARGPIVRQMERDIAVGLRQGGNRERL
jgi:hypothetical protein